MNGIGGHYVSATYFLILGLWWIYSTWLRYFRCKQQKKPYYVTFSFPVICDRLGCSRFPFEAFFLLTAAASGIVIELTAAMTVWIDPRTRQPIHWLSAENLFHFAMYLMFFVLAFVEVCVHYMIWLPRDLELIAGTFAFASEGLLFYYHSQHPDRISVELHLLLVIIILATAIATILELILPKHQPCASLMRGYFTVVQGTWLCVDGYYLDDYRHPHRDKTNSEAIDQLSKLLIVYFILHLIGVLLVLFLLAWLSRLTLFCCFSRSAMSQKQSLLKDEE